MTPTLAASLNSGRSSMMAIPGFFPLVNGMDALGARLDMIEKAEKSIDLQYFLMKDDTAGMVIANALINAADRGVRIRFLLDDVFTTASDQKLLLLNQHPNIQVRLFNPISRSGFYMLNFAGDFKRANRRMHNKSFTVDNAISIVGGRNIADEYFALKHEEVFADFDILAFGEIAKAISGSFDIYWNHSLAVPIERLSSVKDSISLESQRAKVGEEAQKTFEGIYKAALASEVLQDLLSGATPLFVADADVIADNPDKLVNPIGREHMRLAADVDKVLRQAKKELVFISPYYVPGTNGVNYVRNLVDQGVRVAIITNSLASNNHVAVHSAYSGYRKKVVGAGVELYEIRANAGKQASGSDSVDKLTLHTKLILIDRRYLFVGSLNLDPRSLEINAEMGLLIDAEELVGKMAQDIETGIESVAYRVLRDDKGHLLWRGTIEGKTVSKSKEPLASTWLRLKGLVPENRPRGPALKVSTHARAPDEQRKHSVRPINIALANHRHGLPRACRADGTRNGPGRRHV